MATAAKSRPNREVRGDYRNCKGCGDLYPVSVLNFMGECLDCEHFDPRDHEETDR